MNNLIPVHKIEDILSEYRDTPIGWLLEYHNLNRPHDEFNRAQILIGMCMDYRKSLNIPKNFAYIIRTGGGNLRQNEFQISYAIGVGKIDYIALIGHNDCGMVNLIQRKDKFIRGLNERAGWETDKAEEHFMQLAPLFEIGNEVDFTVNETERLRQKYPTIKIAPLIYKVEDNKLYLIKE
jgi:carbonic anhydrase